MSTYIPNYLSKTLKPIIASMSNHAVKLNDITDPIHSLIVMNPYRKYDILRAGINYIQPYITQYKKHNNDASNQHLKLLTSVDVNLKLELSDDKFLRAGAEDIDGLIFRKIVKEFDELFDEFEDPRNGHRISSDNFIGKILKLVHNHPASVDSIFKMAITELEFHLTIHKEHLCTYRGNRICPKEQLIIDALTDLKEHYKNYHANQTQAEVAPKINIPLSVQATEINYYLDEKLIEKLGNMSTELDTTKLTTICRELNYNWNACNYYAVSALLRMLLHYIPPYFGFNTWESVCSRYKDPKESRKVNSFKNVCDNLLAFIDSANIIAHQKASHSDFVADKPSTDKRDQITTVLNKILYIHSEKKVEA